MTVRTATCRCSQLTATCRGEPVRVSVCHCLDCQKRSGSAFAAQARWADEHVTLTGTAREWTRIADSGNRVTYRFCPDCGSTVAYTIENWPGVTAIPYGAFAGTDMPAPKFSVYDDRRHGWVEIFGEDVTRTTSTGAQKQPSLDLRVGPD
ncbi:MAG: aldehyde-activating protein [Alphaproteobacteria bacterium HGW-Alphaproteobacteria-18]|nr:MAG: aldehyde-activating protein [Alphaproteobacteria bacterium HGW-Alphaproteobacteria-18]